MIENPTTNYIAELRSTVHEILDGVIEGYDNENQEWLQKWWAVRVRALLERLDSEVVEARKR
jgi:hypothetical protein